MFEIEKLNTQEATQQDESEQNLFGDENWRNRRGTTIVGGFSGVGEKLKDFPLSSDASSDSFLQLGTKSLMRDELAEQATSG